MRKLKPSTEGDKHLYVHPSIFDRIKNTGYGIVRIGYNSDCHGTDLNTIHFLSRIRNKRQLIKVANLLSKEIIEVEISGIICKCCYGLPIRNIYKVEV